MAYTVRMRNNETGEVRDLSMDFEWPESDGDFLWSDGNYACDCNRALFFFNWGPEAEDRHCGVDGFSVQSITLPDGRMVYSDDN